MNKKLKGSIIAAAAAGLFIAGGNLAISPVSADAHLGKCKIKNNSCKGKGACNCPTKPENLCAEGENHGCAGKNSCKGQGWVYLSDDAGKVKMVTQEDCDKMKPSIFKTMKKEEEKKS